MVEQPVAQNAAAANVPEDEANSGVGAVQAKPKPAPGKFDPGMYDLIVARKEKYKVAVQYCKSELGNNELLLRALDSAEKCAKVAKGYQDNAVIDKANLPPNLTPELLFGVSAADKADQFDTIIAIQEQAAKDAHAAAQKCLEGSKKVKKPAEVEELRRRAGTYVAAVQRARKQVTELKAQKDNPWSAPPDTKTVTSRKMVAKINEEL